MLTMALAVICFGRCLHFPSKCNGAEGTEPSINLFLSGTPPAGPGMARPSLRLLPLLLVLLACACYAQNTRSILERYNVNVTNVLGLRLNRLVRLISEFQDPLDVVTSSGPARAPTTTEPRPVTGQAAVPEYPILAVDPDRPADSSIIMLHGVDSRPRDLIILATSARAFLPTTRFVLPRAPVADVTYLRRRATSWFDVLERKPGRENEAELRRAAKGVSRLVEQESREQNIPPERVIVLGMSQGGAVALTFYLAEETKVGGVVAASTWLPIPTKWRKNTLAAANARTNSLVLHGARDRVISAEEASDSVRRLRSLGRTVKYIEYQRGGHTLAEEITKVALDVITFVKMQLGQP